MIVGAGGGTTVTPYVPVSDAIVVDPDENPAAASWAISRTTETRVDSSQPSADGGEHDVLSPVPEQSMGEGPSMAMPLAATIDVPGGAVSTQGAPDGSGWSFLTTAVTSSPGYPLADCTCVMAAAGSATTRDAAANETAMSAAPARA